MDVRALGIDLAWASSRGGQQVNETGVVALDPSGAVLDAGWTIGVSDTADWMAHWAVGGDALAFIDAPLIVDNDSGQRLCEREVGQRYGRWHVSANSTNRRTERLAGVELREQLERQAGATTTVAPVHHAKAV